MSDEQERFDSLYKLLLEGVKLPFAKLINIEFGKIENRTTEEEILRSWKDGHVNPFLKKPKKEFKESLLKGLILPFLIKKEDDAYILYEGHHRFYILKDILPQNQEVPAFIVNPEAPGWDNFRQWSNDLMWRITRYFSPREDKLIRPDWINMELSKLYNDLLDLVDNISYVKFDKITWGHTTPHEKRLTADRFIKNPYLQDAAKNWEGFKQDIFDNGMNFPIVLAGYQDNTILQLWEGGHRFTAIKDLIDEGKLDKNVMIPCVIKSEISNYGDYDKVVNRITEITYKNKKIKRPKWMEWKYAN